MPVTTNAVKKMTYEQLVALLEKGTNNEGKPLSNAVRTVAVARMSAINSGTSGLAAASKAAAPATTVTPSVQTALAGQAPKGIGNIVKQFAPVGSNIRAFFGSKPATGGKRKTQRRRQRKRSTRRRR